MKEKAIEAEETINLKEQDEIDNKSSSTSYQELIISSIGEMGRWQYFLILAYMVSKVVMVWGMVSVSFTLGKTDWWKETNGIDPKSMNQFLFKDFPSSDSDRLLILVLKGKTD